MNKQSKKYTRFIAGMAAIMCVGMLANCSNSSYNDKGANEVQITDWTEEALLDLTVRDYVAENGIVCAANPFAAKAGLDVLQAGGNAYDAAVAVSFALGVCEPYASGVGGGGIMVSYDATKGEYNCYNFREFAPETTDVSKIYISRASAVPTQVAGLLTIQENHGVLTRQEVMAPAIDLAENGFTITTSLGSNMSTAFATTKDTKSNGVVTKEAINPSYNKVFGNGIRALKAGETLVQKDYANTLKAISENGKAGFYEGWVADAIVNSQQNKLMCLKAGTYGNLVLAKGDYINRSTWETLSSSEQENFTTGYITAKDLQYAMNNYPKKVDPIVGTYGDFDIITANAPSSGGIILVEALNMIEHYNNTASAGKTIKELGHNTADYLHVVSTALSSSYGDRLKYFGDPEFIDIPLYGLTSKAYAADRWDAIYDPDVAFNGSITSGQTDYGQPWEYNNDITDGALYTMDDSYQSDSTTSFSVADKDGNIVTITQTINTFWASQIVPEGCGFFMNNEMADFTTSASASNYVEPFKQPSSYMMPTIIMKDGNPWATFGSPGGTRIPSAVTQIALNLMEFDMEMQEAIEAKRIYAFAPSSSKNTSTGTTKYEVEIEGMDETTATGLETKGYYVDKYTSSISSHFGGVQGIRFDKETGKIYGGADPRRDGKAIGY